METCVCMRIYLFDGSHIDCDVIETCPKGVICDEDFLISFEDIIRIVAKRK